MRRVLAAAALVAGVVLLLATTGPNPPTQSAGPVRRFGGVCLELEKWQLFGWGVIGQTSTVDEALSGLWHEPVDTPECADVPHRIWLIRPPFEAPNGAYRVCPLADDEPCVEFSRVPYQGTPGP